MQQNLSPARSDALPRLRGGVRKNRLFATVAVATLAALVVFSLFYVIGALVGLALIGALGAALIVGLAWLSMRASRRRRGSRHRDEAAAV